MNNMTDEHFHALVGEWLDVRRQVAACQEQITSLRTILQARPGTTVITRLSEIEVEKRTYASIDNLGQRKAELLGKQASLGGQIARELLPGVHYQYEDVLVVRPILADLALEVHSATTSS